MKEDIFDKLMKLPFLNIFDHFFTNRIWVFNAPTNGAKEFFAQLISFFGGRVVTLVIEEVILLVFITWLHFPSMVIKIIAQVVVIVLNYVISKLVVFKK